MKDPIKIVSFAERSDLLPAIDEMIMQHWPKFMLQTSVDDSYWERLYKKPFAEYQFVAISGEGDEEKVIRALEGIIEWRGKPAAIRCDNGPEYISQKLVDWANFQKITLIYTQPGRPTQNAYIERFNRTLRE